MEANEEISGRIRELKTGRLLTVQIYKVIHIQDAMTFVQVYEFFNSGYFYSWLCRGLL